MGTFSTRNSFIKLLLIIYKFQCILCSSFLFPFGPEASDEILSRDSDDISSPELRLSVPIIFYGQQYGAVYINQNGLISFQTEIPRFVNVQFPLDYPSIAAFYSDVDTRITGSIFYREEKSPELLEKARVLFANHFTNAGPFQPSSLLIVTWDNVGSYERKSDKTNSYQLVVVSDGGESYVLFIYDKIEWIQGSGKNPSIPDAKAQAGLISGNGPFYSLRGSGTDQVSNLHKRSNVDSPGLWAFRIGRVVDKIEEPDLNVKEESTESSSSCAVGGTTCHSQGECIDYSPGFCCKCGPGYYGNGKICLKDGIPLRATGKVRGVLNGVSIEDADYFSYIMPLDGRAYTAVANVPERVGYELQSLSVIGTIIGWLFSISIKGAPNGFLFTGGVFNYTGEITFVQTGQKVTINQIYSGLDVFSSLRIDTRINGNSDIIPIGKTIEVNDYDMQMTRVSPGLIRSKSSHNYKIEGTSANNLFSIEQTIAYEECQWAPPVPPEFEITNMKVGRNYIVYDPSQKIVRYAIASKVTPSDGEDPCKENRSKCRPNSSCVANEDKYKCICNLGYEAVNVDGVSRTETPDCEDINECRIGTSICDVTAICINTDGSYKCECPESYVGDGYTCSKVLTCADVQCGTNAECLELKQGEPECRCLTGFYGDGLFCIPQTGREIDPGTVPDCRNLRLCDANAECIFSSSSNSYICSCNRGYYGDGTRCERDQSYSDKRVEEGGSESDCREPYTCHPYGECLHNVESNAYYCSCRFPFVGDGYECRDSRRPTQQEENPEPECTFGDQCWCPQGFEFDDLRHRCVKGTLAQSKTCDVDPAICGLNANCAPNPGGYECVCNAGFTGDGIRCLPENLCRSHAECGESGECVYSRTELRYRCDCRPGFSSDGTQCIASSPPQSTGCDITNNCAVDGRCVWNRNGYECECKPGFIGDGLNCEEDFTGCNVLHNCARNAECAYEPVSNGYRCQCRQGFEGDGTKCRSLVPCYQDRSVCDMNAECVPNQETREWRCSCKQGYYGDGFDCQESGVREDDYLVVAKGMSIVKVHLNGSSSEPLIVDPLQISIGIDIDCPNEKIYWSDVSGRTIKSSFFNGTSKSSFIETDIGSPEGLSIDWGAQNLYWTDSHKDTIEVANLISRKRKTLISTGLVNPRGIAVYPQRGRLFWSDWNRDYPKIEFSGLDGQNRQTLVGEGLSLPNSLLIDYRSDELCFADAGTHKIECVGIDGRNRRTFVSNAKYPFGLVFLSDTFYWSDWETKNIESASKSSGLFGKSIEVPLGGFGKLYGLVKIPKFCPHSNSPCSQNSCPDEYICLPNLRGARSCLCTNSSPSNCTDIIV